MNHIWFVIVLAAWSAICNVWGYLLLVQFRARRKNLFLPELDVNRGRAPEVSATVRIIVPVRNVGADAVPCLNSILAQTGINWRLTVVDDRSDDDTLEQVRHFVGQNPAVEILRIDALPSGWLGKSHALWTAGMDASEDWLLFIDDDCILAPTAVRQAIAYAASQHADFLTLWPRHLAVTFWEHLVIPLCGGIIALWFGARDVNRDDSPVAFGNGQFILVRRDDYRRMGGHATVRDAIIEDVPLAEVARRAGLRCRVASGSELFGVRMYRNYRGLIDGWTRIFVGALRSGFKLVVSMLWLLFGNLLPCLTLPMAIIGVLALPPSFSRVGAAVIGMSVVHIALMMLVSYRFWGMGRCDRRYLWMYPLTVVVVIRILAASWYRLTVCRSISWRDTLYRIDRAGRILQS